MQMPFGMVWLSLIVVIRFIVDFLGEHVLGSWLRHHLKSL